MQKGGEFIIFNNKGEESTVLIKNISSDAIKVEVRAKSKNQSESINKITLYCSILKKENFELVTQKATEIGVSRIVPVISATIEEEKFVEPKNQEEFEKHLNKKLPDPKDKFRYATSFNNSIDLFKNMH